MLYNGAFKIDVIAKDVFNNFKALDNSVDYADSFMSDSPANDKPKLTKNKSSYSVNIGHKMPVFKLQFPHSEMTVRKNPLKDLHKKKFNSVVQRIICYSLALASNEKAVVPYLDLKNRQIKSHLNIIHPSKIIDFVENSVKVLKETKFDQSMNIKQVSFLGATAYYITEGSHSMILVGKSLNTNPTSLKHDKHGDRELKWSILTIWHNFKVLHKSSQLPKQSNQNSNQSLPQLSVNEYINQQQSVPSDGSISIENESVTPNKLRQRNEKFNGLMKLFQPIKELNPNLLHKNINRFSDKFNSHLKDTTEIQLLKFLPSQFFLAVSNSEYTKLTYRYNFRDHLKNDYSDFSMNVSFLGLLHYHINNFWMKSKTQNRAKNRNNHGRNENKTTNSGTKSRMMNNPVEDDSKQIDDDESGLAAIIDENSSSMEFTLPGFLIRINQTEGMQPFKNREHYF
jgi:hypothetical protein